MAVVRIDLEVNDKGSGQVINNVGGSLKMMGAEGIKAGAAIGTGFTLAQKAIESVIGVLQTVGSAVSTAIQGLVSMGGQLADLSAQTGISSQALQKLAYAGSLVGVSQEAVTAAAVKMEKAIANGDSVFQRLGLSVQNLKNMQPDQAFAAIAAKIASIKNPMDQAAAAMEVFGKSGATLLPLIKSDLKAAGEEAERLGIVLGDKTVTAADALGDEVTKLEAAWKGVQNQFAAAIIENPVLLAALQNIVTKMGDLSQWLIKNKSEIGDFTTAVVGWGTTFVDWIEKVGARLIAVGNNPAVKFLNSALLKVAGYATGVGLLGGGDAGGPSAGSGTGHMAPGSSYGAIGGGTDFISKGAAAAAAAAAKAHAAAAAKAQKAWQEAAEKGRAANDKFTASVRDNANKQMLDIQNLFDKRTKAHTKMLDAELKAEYAHRDMLLDLGEKNDKIFAEMEKQRKARRLDDIQGLGDALQNLGAATGSGTISTIGQLASDWATFAKEAANAKTMVEKVTVAINAAASAYQSGFESKSVGKGALQGAAKGAGAGAAFGPYGAIIGGIIGAGIGIFGAKKGQAAEMKALTAEFNSLMAQAQKAGITITKAFDTRSAKGLKAAIADLNKTLDNTTEAQQKVKEAAERYGFTIEELGPAMARQKLDEQMAQIYQDWQLLAAAGVDHEAMLTRIGPEVGKLVDQYVSAGVEIPSAMKPIIDDLYEHHKLLHENGDEYTDAEYKGISYAQTMSQMFQELISKVNDLVSALLGIPNTTSTHTIVTRRVGDPGVDEGGGGENGGGVRTRSTSTSERGGVVLHMPVTINGAQQPAMVLAELERKVNQGFMRETLRKAVTGRRGI